MQVGGVQLHGDAEFLSCGVRIAGLEQRVSEVLADVGAAWRKFRSAPQVRHGAVKIPIAQRFERGCEHRVGGVVSCICSARPVNGGRDLGERGCRYQADR